MLTYKFDEELKFAKYYAEKLNDKVTLNILDAGVVSNEDEATHLSLFFWKMVDASIVDERSHVELPWEGGSEFWNEKLMNSISGYLGRAGYEKEWDEVSDQQNS